MTPNPAPPHAHDPPPTDVGRVRIEWTVPPFGVIFGVVWRVGVAVVLCYGIAFVLGLMLVGAAFRS